jgi:hypothetical protein
MISGFISELLCVEEMSVFAHSQSGPRTGTGPRTQSGGGTSRTIQVHLLCD